MTKNYMLPEPSPPPHAMSGLVDLNERYRILAKLGVGGMAEVFLGIQRGSDLLERLVAVKRMRSLNQNDSAQMFVHEARVVAALTHPHVVKVYDLGLLEDDIAIAMEYVDGENLQYIMSETRRHERYVPLPIVIKLMIEAAEALHYAHTAVYPDGRPLNVIHRDVGPHNLLLAGNGYLKVIDFGIAKSSAYLDVTTPGLVRGKIPYFSPESLTGPAVDSRSDLYALGLVMFELISLRRAHPFASDVSIADVIERITKARLPQLSKHLEHVPSGIDAVIDQATRTNPDERFQTGAEFAEALRGIGDTTVGVATTQDVQAWYTTQFAERVRLRREFERSALASSREASLALDPLPAMRRGAISGSASVPSRERAIMGAPPPVSTGSQAKPFRPSRAMVAVALALILGCGAGIGFAFTRFDPEPAPGSPSTTNAGVVYMAADNLFVASKPPGAEVFIDGQPIGNTGETGINLRIAPSQACEVVVRKAGFLDYELRVVGEAFGQRQIRATLTPDPNRPDRTDEEAQDTETLDEDTPDEDVVASRRLKKRDDLEENAADELEPAKDKAERLKARRAARLEASAKRRANKAADVPDSPEEDAAEELEKEELAEIEIPPPPASPPMLNLPPALPEGPIEQSATELMSRRRGGKAPTFPRRELELGRSGVVKIAVELNAEGRVTRYETKSGPFAFKRAVESVIESWQFAPLKFNGIPVASRGLLVIEFTVE